MYQLLVVTGWKLDRAPQGSRLAKGPRGPGEPRGLGPGAPWAPVAPEGRGKVKFPSPQVAFLSARRLELNGILKAWRFPTQGILQSQLGGSSLRRPRRRTLLRRRGPVRK